MLELIIRIFLPAWGFASGRAPVGWAGYRAFAERIAGGMGRMRYFGAHPRIDRMPCQFKFPTMGIGGVPPRPSDAERREPHSWKFAASAS